MNGDYSFDKQMQLDAELKFVNSYISSSSILSSMGIYCEEFFSLPWRVVRLINICTTDISIICCNSSS